MAYLDDILIFSPSEKEHKQHIQKSFDYLRQHNLKLKVSKCKFMQKEAVSGLHNLVKMASQQTPTR